MRSIRFPSIAAAGALVSLAWPSPVRAEYALFVCSPYQGGEAVYKFDSGAGRSTFASLTTPQGLAFDDAGDVIVASELGRFVRRYSPSGSLLQTINLPGQGRAPVVDGAGNIYVALGPLNAVHKYSPGGTLLQVLNAGVLNPTALALDAGGNLLVMNNTGGAIRKFAPDGASLGTFATAGGIGGSGLAFDSLGNLYAGTLAASGTAIEVHRFAPDGTALGLFATSGGLNGGGGLDFGPDGALYVAGSQPAGGSVQGTIRRYSPTGEDLGVFYTASAFYPTHLKFAPASVPEPGSAVSTALGLGAVAAAAVVRSTVKSRPGPRMSFR